MTAATGRVTWTMEKLNWKLPGWLCGFFSGIGVLGFLDTAGRSKTIQNGPFIGAVILVFVTSACSERIYDEIDLMPPPIVFHDGIVDPFPTVESRNSYDEMSQLYYATDRRPATAADKQRFYANDRGHILRAGMVDVVAEPRFADWDELRAASLTPEGRKKRVLRIAQTREIGALPTGDPSLLPGAPDAADMDAVGQEFAAAINHKLSLSPEKDIFIYVHGVNVDFDYPILAAKELQHYLGYRGAFIAYAWPATPNRFAYFKDLENVDATRKNLRELIVFLSRRTQARKIHVIGFSAGSRLAFEAAYDLALLYPGKNPGGLRLGKLILIGSELDRSYFVQAIGDGLLNVVDELSVYMSTKDNALKMSSILLARQRLGQLLPESDFNREIEARLVRLKNLNLIDVTEAEDSATGNGHGYFRSSPWASSDILVSLLYDIPPADRGLVRAEGRAVWHFPADYPERIVRAASGRPD